MTTLSYSTKLSAKNVEECSKYWFANEHKIHETINKHINDLEKLGELYIPLRFCRNLCRIKDFQNNFLENSKIYNDLLKFIKVHGVKCPEKIEFSLRAAVQILSNLTVQNEKCQTKIWNDCFSNNAEFRSCLFLTPDLSNLTAGCALLYNCTLNSDKRIHEMVKWKDFYKLIDDHQDEALEKSFEWVLLLVQESIKQGFLLQMLDDFDCKSTKETKYKMNKTKLAILQIWENMTEKIEPANLSLAGVQYLIDMFIHFEPGTYLNLKQENPEEETGVKVDEIVLEAVYCLLESFGNLTGNASKTPEILTLFGKSGCIKHCLDVVKIVDDMDHTKEGNNQKKYGGVVGRAHCVLKKDVKSPNSLKRCLIKIITNCS
eukprot:UN34742